MKVHAMVCAQERELCASVRMLPGQYLSVKAAMLREAARRDGQHLPRSEARTMFRLEPSRALRVYDLLAAAGWIRAAPPPPPAATMAAAAPAAAAGPAAPAGPAAEVSAGSPAGGSFDGLQPVVVNGADLPLEGKDGATEVKVALPGRSSFPGFNVPM
jgi:hypothetical protein